MSMILVLVLGLSVGAAQKDNFLLSLGLSEEEVTKIEAQCKINGYMDEIAKEIQEQDFGGFYIDESNTLHIYLVFGASLTKTMREIQNDTDVVFMIACILFRNWNQYRKP